MAHTAHKDPKQVQEHYDPSDVLSKKVKALAELVRSSKHLVVFTGAGISTSAGISDFRGPQGVWTRKAKGLAPIAGTPVVRALPTKTHMALVQLQQQGQLKYVVSQNCDGLHRRSGLPASSISELHGNGNIEICEDCGRRYFRDFKCDRRAHTFDHFTGRFCQCDGPHGPGRLLNSTIDFGQSLPSQPLQRATEESSKADLHIVLGSSLTVSPACTMPEKTVRRGGKLVIVNLQETPLTSKAHMHIHAPTDDVMIMLMEHLGIPIPPFRLERRILITQEGNAVAAKSVDIHDPDLEVGVLCGVDWDGTQQPVPEQQRAKAIWQQTMYTHPSNGLDLKSLHPTLQFVGHYQEPPLRFHVDLSEGGKDIRISFDPSTSDWSVKSMSCIEEPHQMSLDLDTEYGIAHRNYVVGKRREQGSADAEAQVEREFQEARRMASRWADEEARSRARDRAGLILKHHKQVRSMLDSAPPCS